MPKSPSPYAVTLSDEQRDFFGRWLSTQLRNAIDARMASETEVDYWHTLYEQGRTRIGRNVPWPDAADLTSYLASEKVDALQARMMRTIWTEPVWTVEGWGQSADRAPFVEEFHQWKVEEERLQSVLDKWSLISLIEPRGLLEVYESSERRPSRKTMQAAIVTDDLTGGPVYDNDGQPKLQQQDDGSYVEASPNAPAAETTVDSFDVVRTGPQYRILPYRDSLILPGHARDKDEIYGYFKRFWRRFGDLQARAEEGLYDKDSVEQLTDQPDKEPDEALQRSGQTVAMEDTTQMQPKELWEGVILVDCNELLEANDLPKLRGSKYQGARWYLVTVHIDQQVLLRCDYEDLERSRYVPVMLFPRPDRATEGFSFIGHKLLTTIEEHTAWRNMAADRGALIVQAPILRQTGALWDPDEQPFGPKAVIDVRAKDEISAFQLPEFGLNFAFEQIQACERTAERLAGINDIASGQVAQESRTLGEINMATEQSFVRMDLIVHRMQEALEDVAQIRHAIWKRTLAESPDGVDAPNSLQVGLEGRGVSIDRAMPGGKITAAMLEGSFRFKPHGSVETADRSRQRNDFVAFLKVLPIILQTFPSAAPLFQTPQAARAIIRYFLLLFNVPDKQAFIGSPANDLMQQMMQQLPGGLGVPGVGMPGMGTGPMPPPMAGPPGSLPMPPGSPSGLPS